MGDKIFVFDFDLTIVTENSDTYIPLEVFRSSSAKKILRAFNPETHQWNETVDRMLVALQEVDGLSQEQIRQAGSKVPTTPEMIKLLKLITSQGYSLHIVSDANDVFIEAFLKHHDVKATSVLTNPTVVEHHLLRLKPMMVDHGCDMGCPPNQCKSILCRDLLKEHQQLHGEGGAPRPQLVYFGDGGNDFCPVANVLNEDDVVFVREDLSKPKALGLSKRLKRTRLPIRPKQHRWVTGADLLATFQTEFASSL